ncbi:MAG: UDP-3-O-acyl-N-acetylglucosamine deacetylase, partial [Muribaculaceae bacterium]|nr:UDP-3-O-acyl-N-acetylglucosamine deacetylase [Muribaculaceae bacterium]
MKQRTLKGEFTLQGKGLHTGLRINATMRPAPASTGYVFRRIDLEGQPTIDALAENVVDTRRGTVIASKSNREARVSTIEHALAALYAAGIDNCFIDVDAPELPILDGSAIMWADKIDE